MRTVTHPLLLPDVHDHFRRWSGIALVTLLFILSCVANLIGGLATLTAGAILLAAAGVRAAILRTRASVVLGDDGITIIAFARRRFIPHTNVRRAAHETDASTDPRREQVVVTTCTGDITLVFAARSEAVKFAQHLRATIQRLKKSPPVLLPISPTGRLSAPYRDAAATAERLLAVLASPAGAPQDRATAGWRIATEHPTHIDRVAQAADESAHPTLRRFLRSLELGQMSAARQMLPTIEDTAEP